MPLDARWYCFFFPIQRAADKANWHEPTALISGSYWLVTPLPGRSTDFWPHPPCTLDRNLAFPTKRLRFQSQKKNLIKERRPGFDMLHEVRQRRKFWSDSRRSEWNLFRVSQRGGCHGSAELSFCVGPGSWSWKRPKLGFVTECTANVGVVEASWALD